MGCRPRKSPGTMRSSDKLIRQKCPACLAEITLGNSSLDKKIQCPRCRQAVVISSDHPVATAHVSNRENGAQARSIHETAMPAETLPVHGRHPGEDTRAQHEQPDENEKEPVIYCLCNGVLKKRIISAEWGPARNVCCMNAEKATS